MSRFFLSFGLIYKYDIDEQNNYYNRTTADKM